MSEIIYSMNGSHPIFEYLNRKDETPIAEHYAPARLLTLPEVEITEEVYEHFLEVLFPAFWESSGFVMREATTETADGEQMIASSFRRAGNHFYHRYVAIPRESWYREVG